MAGSYCKFCDHRCFVERTMPADAKWRPGETVHLATCARGMEHDREKTGYDKSTAINPAAAPWPSADEQEVIDRFGIFQPEQDREALRHEVVSANDGACNCGASDDAGPLFEDPTPWCGVLAHRAAAEALGRTR